MSDSVIFVTAPYLSVVRPALGVSTLKGSLEALGIATRIEYLNMRFAETAGVEITEYIAERTATKFLIGEWTFARTLNGERGTAGEREYIRWLEGYLGTDRFRKVLQLRELTDEFVERSAWKLADSGAQIVGFSSSFQQTCASLAIARRLKEFNPGVVLCFGGANCEGPMGRALLTAYPFIDYVFSGESDRSFPDAAQRILAGDSPPGDGVGVFRRERGDEGRTISLPPVSISLNGSSSDIEFISDLDELPIPSFDDYFGTLSLMSYRDRVDVGMLFETSRGCWWGAKKHCRFCGLNGKGMTYRVKSPARILEEIDTLHSRWGVDLFEAADNIMHMQHVETVFRPLAERVPPLTFFYEIKSNMTAEQLTQIARGGVTWIQPGIESLDDDILNLMEKGVSMLQNVRLLRTCQEIGIRSIWNMLWGFPGERGEQYRRMAEVMLLLEHLDPPSGISQVRLDRFSPYYEQSARLGFVDVVPTPAYGVIHDIDPSLLPEIAYFFDGTPTDVDPGDYVAPIREAVANWRRRADNREEPPCLMLIHIGPLAAIKDTRFCSRERWRFVEPDELRMLELFREPAQVERTLAKLTEESDKDHTTTFNGLVDLGYILVDGGRALSLVVETGRLVRPPEKLERNPVGSLLDPPAEPSTEERFTPDTIDELQPAERP